MNKIFIFLLGGAVGSLVTWKIVEERYRQIAEDEIRSVIEEYEQEEEEPEYASVKEESKKIDDFFENKELNKDKYHTGDVQLTEEEKKEYEEMLEDEGYIVSTESKIDYIAPYVITPDEFGEFGNDIKSWTLYSDGVITDEVGDIVDMPENIVGDALEHFGEHEPDCVHVRNEDKEWDIEILKSEKSFSEINSGDN